MGDLVQHGPHRQEGEKTAQPGAKRQPLTGKGGWFHDETQGGGGVVLGPEPATGPEDRRSGGWNGRFQKEKGRKTTGAGHAGEKSTRRSFRGVS